jgi:hypothetical protein
MLSLEQVLLTLKAKDTITILGEAYNVKNVVSATDGKVLKAHLNLVKAGMTDFCISIEVSTRLFESVDLEVTKI